MAFCKITLSANAGIAIHLGNHRIWVDALHHGQVCGFSTLSPKLLTAVASHPDFESPNLIFYTHCHPDHFSKELTQQAIEHWSLAQTVLPEKHFEHQHLLSKPLEQLQLSELSMQFIRLPHEGEQFADVNHYGCVLNCNGFRVLIPGDCAVASSILKEYLKETGQIDLALLDFPWVTLEKGRQFIQQYIRPNHLIVYHLPFASDDVYGYRQATAKALSSVNVPDVRLLQEPLQIEQF